MDAMRDYLLGFGLPDEEIAGGVLPNRQQYIVSDGKQPELFIPSQVDIIPKEWVSTAEVAKAVEPITVQIAYSVEAIAEAMQDYLKATERGAGL